MTKSWTALGVPERIVAGLLKRGIAEPFPVQAATIPESLMGLDICGKAPTGSGKTLAAFLYALNTCSAEVNFSYFSLNHYIQAYKI